jgi:hypothetical protein
MKAARYEFAEGARFQPGANKADPNLVGQHLDLLRQQFKGELTPPDVVTDARNPNSPLHPFFEWDDTAAAEAHRLSQARGLIRAVVAVYVSEDKPATRMKAFVHIPEPGAEHYRDAVHALSQDRTRAMVLERALAELVAWKKRYRELTEFAELVEVIDRIGKDLPKAAPRG